jgi:UDP-N-acetylmuramate dehydrogenase
VEPANASDLKKVLAFVRERRIPFFIIGNGSNLLVSDCGYGGVMISLAASFFKKMNLKGRTIIVGGGYSLPRLVREACERSLSGLESMVGIPGTVGGSIYMNAGGYTNPIFKNMDDLVTSLKVMDYSGNMKTLKKEEIGFGYRFSDLDGYVILEAKLKLGKGDRETLLSSISQFLKMKKDKQVLDMPSAGCLFKNPPNFQFTCGQMIDMLGLKGKRIGGAEVSEKHANFIINRDNATCKDILAMIDFIKNKVKENYDVTLGLEVKII